MPPTKDVSARITAHIEAIEDWRGPMLARARELIHQALPGVLEEWKWAKPTSPGVPVWSSDGIICTGEVYKAYVKLTFAHGAALPDPKGLFNASLGGGTRRAIDLHEGDRLNAVAFKALIRAAAKANAEARAAKRRS